MNKSVLSEARVGHPVPAGDVYVYFATDSIPPHERVAILAAEGNNVWTNRSQMIDELCEQAGKLGANAIILLGVEDANPVEKVAAAIFGGDLAERTGEAIAIYIKPEDR